MDDFDGAIGAAAREALDEAIARHDALWAETRRAEEALENRQRRNTEAPRADLQALRTSDYFTILGLAPTLDDIEIATAYWSRRTSAPGEILPLIEEAYLVLSDRERRAAYFGRLF